MNRYEQKAADLIEQYFKATTREEEITVVEIISEEDLAVIEALVLDSVLYKEFWNKSKPELMDPPAGFKGRS